MLDLIVAGGWLMLPIILLSIVGVAIIAERFWSLRVNQVAPRDLLPEVSSWLRQGELSRSRLETLREHSPLGRILASGLSNARHGRDIMKETIEETASQEVYGLSRFLNMLNSVAEVAPMLGLLGTVSGMIQIFATIFASGNGDIEQLAGGISVALITTAAGLVVAIPALFCHRYFVKRVEMITLLMEQDATKLVTLLQSSNAFQNSAKGNQKTKKATAEKKAALSEVRS